MRCLFFCSTTYTIIYVASKYYVQLKPANHLTTNKTEKKLLQSRQLLQKFITPQVSGSTKCLHSTENKKVFQMEFDGL